MPVSKTIAAKTEVEICRRPVFSIQRRRLPIRPHRCGDVLRSCYNYAVVNAVRLRNFRITMKQTDIFMNSTDFSRTLPLRFRPNFPSPYSNSGTVDMCNRNPMQEFKLSTKSRPNYSKNQISNFHILLIWGGAIRHTLNHFYQSFKAVTWKSQLSGVEP